MKILKVSFLLCLGLLVAQGVVFAAGGAQGGKIGITFAGTEGDAAGQSRMMKEVADILNKTGKFDVKVFTAGALSGDTDNLVKQAVDGTPLVIPSDPGRLASQFNIPDMNILMSPYVLTDYKALEKLPQTALYQKWQKQLEDQGVVLIADMFNGFRNFYTVTPVTKVADLKGLRIRGFGNNIGNALAKYLGYAQTTMNATDVYSAVQAKSLDGTEIQASTGDSYRLYEVTKNLAVTKHYMLQSAFVVSKKLLDAMPEAERKLFLDTVTKTATKYSGIIAGEEQGYYDNFTKNGGKINQVNITEFQNAVAPLYINNDLKLSPGLKDDLFKQLGL